MNTNSTINSLLVEGWVLIHNSSMYFRAISLGKVVGYLFHPYSLFDCGAKTSIPFIGKVKSRALQYEVTGFLV